MHGPSTAAGRRRPDAGFSLIELMIVLLIIAILLAVAIPTYLSARNRAENRAAQETLANVLIAAKADYASQGTFTPLDGTSTLRAYLQAQNPSVKMVSDSTALAAVNTVGEAHGVQHILLGAWAPDGRCFYLLDVESTSSSSIPSAGLPGPGTFYKEGSAASGCTVLVNATVESWQTSWTAAAANYKP